MSHHKFNLGDKVNILAAKDSSGSGTVISLRFVRNCGGMPGFDTYLYGVQWPGEQELYPAEYSEEEIVSENA